MALKVSDSEYMVCARGKDPLQEVVEDGLGDRTGMLINPANDQIHAFSILGMVKEAKILVAEGRSRHPR